jgi:hypothetical protein
MQRTASAGYETDLALWAQEQAVALRERRLADLDFEHIAEEMDGLASSDRREIQSRLKQICAHLLKFQHQPERATPSWRETIIEQADEIEAVLEASPSLRCEMPDFMARAYARARRVASKETLLSLTTFPATPTPEFEHALQAALAGEDFGF